MKLLTTAYGDGSPDAVAPDPRAIPKTRREMQIGRKQSSPILTKPRLGRLRTEKDLIPVNAHVGPDPDLAAGGKKLQIDRDGSRLSRRHTHIRVYDFPLPGRVLHLEIRRPSPCALSCDAARNVLPSAQSTQPCSSRVAFPDGAASPKSNSRVCISATPMACVESRRGPLRLPSESARAHPVPCRRARPADTHGRRLHKIASRDKAAIET